jgi:hypothetical protein
MTKTMVRLGFTFLLSILMIAATKPASAQGTLVTVKFSGSGFTGWFEYDQSQSDSSPGQFKFQGSRLTHKICYTITSAACTPFSMTQCEPFTITTSGGSKQTFELTTTAPKSPTAVSVVIVLPMGNLLSQTSLPLCGGFPASPNAGSKFTLSGGSSFTGTITQLSCTQSAPAVLPAPAPPSPCDVVYIYPVPAPNPVSVCQPRPACCFSGLFHRKSLRMCCR